MERPRLVWCDALRLLAFFLLFCCHAVDPFNAAATYGAQLGDSVDPIGTVWGARWGAIVRPCVPLFVMLTGVLLLPGKTSMGSFYKRRIPRVLFPFLIWSVIYYMTPWFTGILGLDKNVVHKLFCWASDSQELYDALSYVACIPYNFNFIACHMWYIYMLIGLYLYIPILSAWVEKATKQQKELVLALWALSTMLPYFNEFISHYAFGTCEWNSFGLFYYFAGFSGYMLLGHYIKEYINWGIMKTLLVSVPLLACGFLITLYGFNYIMSMEEQTPEQVELFWTYNTPNVAMMSIALFLIMTRVRISSNSRTAKLLASLTSCGFGMYMIHYYFVFLGYQAGVWLHIPTPLRIPFSALVIMVCSWSVIALAKKLLNKKADIIFG